LKTCEVDVASQVAEAHSQVIALPRAAWLKFSWTWLGVVPFFAFVTVFLILPSSALFIGALQDAEGNFTLKNIAGLFTPYVLEAYSLSIRVSLVTALAGGIFGFLMAYAVTLGRLPRVLGSGLLIFSGLAANFGGVPLAFSFIATVGRTGFITAFLATALGINLYDLGFNLYSFIGLCLVYMYFQLPLMILVMTPAFNGLKREWREASENLGASSWQYWRHIGLPILMPSMLGMLLLLFGSAFGAYATAFALTGGTLNLVTIVIGAQIRGDVLNDPHLGYALVLGMVAVMSISITGYTILQRRSARWLK
jgi:putative spermidine/putrescine transport system permease protein